MIEPRDTIVNEQNPFPGLRSFTEEAQQYFFGRIQEAAELHRLARRDTVTVLFGRSGLGKTSLLEAGLFPLLRASEFFPVRLRLRFGPGVPDPTDQIKAAFAQQLAQHQIDAPAPDANQTLWEYLHRVRLWDQKNRLLAPVLVFDQFEEVFTLGADDARTASLLDTLEELIENRIPPSVRRRIEAGEDLPFSCQKQNHRVILSLREDFLASFEALVTRMPSLTHQRMRLMPMNIEQALEAIEKPAGPLVDHEAAVRIAEFVAATGRKENARVQTAEGLTTTEVEPALLALVCFELNRIRLARQLPCIDTQLLHFAQTGILTDFYEHSLSDLRPEVRQLVEDRLLTSSGYRSTLALDDALRVPGVSREAVDALVNRRLLRVEMHLGIPHLELTHDVLTGVIQSARQHRQTEAIRQEESRRHRQMRRRFAVAAALLVAFAVFAGAVALFAISDRDRAQAAERAAEAAKLEALNARSDAVQKSTEASQAQTKAEAAQKQAMRAVVGGLLKAEITHVPTIIEELGPLRQQADPLLRSVADDVKSDLNQRLRANLALLPTDPSRIGFLRDRLLDSSLQEFTVLRDALGEYRAQVAGDLWKQLEANDVDSARGLHAAMALASYDPPGDDASLSRWRRSSGLVASLLMDALYRSREQFDQLTEALRPACAELLGPLRSLYDSPKTDVRKLAAQVLAKYAADRPESLASLILDADRAQFDVLMPLFRTDPNRAAEVMKAELAQLPAADVPPLDPNRASVFRSAQGKLERDFAFCQTMPLAEFLAVAKNLRPSGYRPIRCRPYYTSEGVRVAAVWQRDYKDWCLSYGLSASQMRKTHDAWISKGFVPVDIAGYLSADGSGRLAEQYAAVWMALDTSEEEWQLNIGMPYAEHDKTTKKQSDQDLIPTALQVFTDTSGQDRYSGIWSRHQDTAKYTFHARVSQDYLQTTLGPDVNLLDIDAFISLVPDTRTYLSRRLAEANAEIKEHPGDPDAQEAWLWNATAQGLNRECITRADEFLRGGQDRRARLYYWRCINYAQIGESEKAAADAATYAKLPDAIERCKAYLRTVTAVYRGDWDQVQVGLDSFQAREPDKDGSYLYEAACAYAIAAQHAKEAGLKKTYTQQALQLLRQAITRGWKNSIHLQSDADMDGIRDDPAFQSLIAEISPQYVALWNNSSVPDTVATQYGQSPEELLAKSGLLLSQGLRPITLSVAWSPLSGQLLSASAWHVSSAREQKDFANWLDQRAVRHGRSAILALSELGRLRSLWDLLRDGTLTIERVEHIAGPELDRGSLSGDVQRIIKLEKIKRDKLAWNETTGSARKWWLDFENENQHRIPLVLRLAEELQQRNATITEFFLAYVYSDCNNIQANLHYMDFVHLKKAAEKLRKEGSGPDQAQTIPKELRSFCSINNPAAVPKGFNPLSLESALDQWPDVQTWWEIVKHQGQDDMGDPNGFLLWLAESGRSLEEAFDGAVRARLDSLYALSYYLEFLKYRPLPKEKTGGRIYNIALSNKRDRIYGRGGQDTPVLQAGCIGADIWTKKLLAFAKGDAVLYRHLTGTQEPGFQRFYRCSKCSGWTIGGDCDSCTTSAPESLAFHKGVLENGIQKLLPEMKGYRGEFDPDLVHHIISVEVKPMLETAVRAGVRPDLLDLSKRLSEGAKYLVHEKEIAFSMLLQLPDPRSLDRQGLSAFGACLDQMEREYGGAIERMERLWNFSLSKNVTAL